MPLPPQDSYHRRIDYLRLSITDRCNLRCTYCMPEGGVPRLAHEDILNYEEILRLARVVAGWGFPRSGSPAENLWSGRIFSSSAPTSPRPRG